MAPAMRNLRGQLIKWLTTRFGGRAARSGRTRILLIHNAPWGAPRESHRAGGTLVFYGWRRRQHRAV